jgi:hypothetical protein
MRRAETFVRSRIGLRRVVLWPRLPTAACVVHTQGGQTSVPYIEDEPLIPLQDTDRPQASPVVY